MLTSGQCLRLQSCRCLTWAFLLERSRHERCGAALLSHLVYGGILGAIAGAAAPVTAKEAQPPLNKLGR